MRCTPQPAAAGPKMPRIFSTRRFPIYVDVNAPSRARPRSRRSRSKVREICLRLRTSATWFTRATLRPKDAMQRSHALHAIAHMLEAKNLLALQKGTSRPATGGTMILRSNKGKDLPIAVNSEAFLFREFGESLHQMKSVALVGGEPVTFHVSAKGQVDYLEVKPANNGAAADRFSSLTNWTAQRNIGAV